MDFLDNLYVDGMKTILISNNLLLNSNIAMPPSTTKNTINEPIHITSADPLPKDDIRQHSVSGGRIKHTMRYKPSSSNIKFIL